MYANEAIDLLGCSYNGLRKWGSSGRIRRFKNEKGQWIYNDDDVYSMIGKRVSKESLVTLYCRVAGTTESSQELMREQQKMLHMWCTARGLTVDRLYEDWARATEYSLADRPGLHLLLQDIIQKRIAAVVVETPDRLARIGRELIEQLCRYYGVQLVYVNKAIQRPEYLAEQEEDLHLILKKAKVDRLEELGVKKAAAPVKPKLKDPGKIVPDWEGAPLPPTSRDIGDLSDLM
jgi:predicted site-specific integrase-resolvase